MDIRNCIAELLSEHDCVIIPGFGGFIGNYAPARIDPVNHTFHPPSKQLLFNVNLRHNDGLLASHICKISGLGYSDACHHLEIFSADCTSTLGRGEYLLFAKVGRLFSGKEGNIQFEQHKTANLLPDSFGLGSFISPPVTTHTPVSFRKSRIRREYTGERRIFIKRYARWAAILAVPVSVAAIAGLLQFGSISSKYANNAGILTSVFSRFSSASLVEKRPATPQKPVTAVVKPQAVKPEVSPAVAKVAQTEQPKPEAVPVSVINPDDRYAVIIGAFRMKENADQLIDGLRSAGVEAKIYDCSKSGLYRVTMGTFSRREEALQLLATVQSGDFKEAWLLAK